jgi:hypothetical protein
MWKRKSRELARFHVFNTYQALSPSRLARMPRFEVAQTLPRFLPEG